MSNTSNPNADQTGGRGSNSMPPAGSTSTPRRRPSEYGWTAFVTAAVIAVVGLTFQLTSAETGAHAGPATPVTDDADRRQLRENVTAEEVHYVACMLDAAGTPDSLEHWIDTCRTRAAEAVLADAHYVACMLDAAGTPDSLEHWIDTCRDRAAEAVVAEAAFAACILDAPATPDAVEHWVDTCRQ